MTQNEQQQQPAIEGMNVANFSPTDKNSTSESGSGSSSTNSVTPTTVNHTATVVQSYENMNDGGTLSSPNGRQPQQIYDQNVLAKEKSLLKNFSNLIINDNMMSIQNQLLGEEKNAMIYADLQMHDNKSVANGNSYDFESINTK